MVPERLLAEGASVQEAGPLVLEPRVVVKPSRSRRGGRRSHERDIPKAAHRRPRGERAVVIKNGTLALGSAIVRKPSFLEFEGGHTVAFMAFICHEEGSSRRVHARGEKAAEGSSEFGKGGGVGGEDEGYRLNSKI